METHFPYSRYLLNTFGGKTYKIVVASGLTCPTRDGSIAKAGCSFCDIRGSSSFYGKQGRGGEISDQIRAKIQPIRERFGAQHFLAYFQSYTNTYTSDIGYLRGIYEAALAEPEIEGLCVGTRPDCLADEVLDLLEELAQRKYVSLELGVQSFENPTLEFLERGHDRDCSLTALERLRKRAPSVHVCVHLMFGNPTDSPTCARDAALLLNESGAKGAKLHQLMVLEHTKLGELYKKEPFPTASLEQYAEICGDFLEHLSPEIYVERLCASATHPDECIAPVWSRNRWEPHNFLRDALITRGCRQGMRLYPS